MRDTLLLFLSSFFALFLVSCKDAAKRVQDEPPKTNYVDSLHQNTTTVDIGFFSDFSKSSIQFSAGEISRQSYIDSIFRFIGNRVVNTCALRSLNPDGTMTFYNGHLLITTFYFVLGDTCNGFYDDFLDNANKYDLTSFGKSTLSEFKKKLLFR